MRASWSVAVLTSLVVAAAPGQVLTGLIVDKPELLPPFRMGDGMHEIYTVWSVANWDTHGWFYGSLYGPSFANCDVHLEPNMPDPTVVTDASHWAYSNVYVVGGEGDAVFFRSLQGYYGCVRVDEFTVEQNGQSRGNFSGRWYFVADGSANFSQNRCPGDTEGDLDVDQDDIDAVLFHFGETVPRWRNGDLDGNGVVNQDDIDLVLFNYGCG